MKKILFETHHLYYWPNFRPIIDEMILSEDFEIYVSMPKRNLTLQQNILIKECDNLSIQFITSDSELKELKKFTMKLSILLLLGMLEN